MARIELYETALAAYQSQNWDTAERILLELCSTFGEDSASRTLLERIAILRVSPPAGNWDGTYEAKDK
jgi:outer membrane protein assembly factor BamD (BamD/ComL family)